MGRLRRCLHSPGEAQVHTDSTFSVRQNSPKPLVFPVFHALTCRGDSIYEPFVSPLRLPLFRVFFNEINSKNVTHSVTRRVLNARVEEQPHFYACNKAMLRAYSNRPFESTMNGTLNASFVYLSEDGKGGS